MIFDTKKPVFQLACQVYAEFFAGLSSTDFFRVNDKGVLPRFNGILCHDHWKPYYQYTSCLHALRNVHHLRKLERAYGQDNQL